MSVPLTPAQALQKIPFVNLDTEAVPPCGVMQVSGSVVEDGVAFLACTQVGSTLATEYAVNGLVRVGPGKKGVCYRQGDLPVAFEAGAPQAGEGWGVRPNQWTLARGYPSIVTAHGVRSASGNVLYGTLARLRHVVGVSASDLAPLSGGVPGTGTFAVHVWNGTGFVAADPAMSFTGHNASSSAIKTGTLVQFAETDGVWVVASAAGGTLTRFELTSDLVYGTVPASDNAVVLEYAAGSYLPTGATIRVYDWTAGGGYGTWSGKAPVASPARAGYQGWALKALDSDRYEIVWMEQQARFISFRLYQRLTTAAASQASCAVLSYWDGRDPDPTGQIVTVYNLATDYAGVYKFSGEPNAVGYGVWNEKLGRYQICALEGDGRRWVLFKNVSGYAAPACGVMAQLAVIRDGNGHAQKRTILTAGRPDATFRTTFLINGYADVADGAIGVCCSCEGPVEAIYDSGTPAGGEGWGSKPGQFALAKAYPGFRALGLNADDDLAVVVQEPILQVLCKSTAAIAKDTSSTAYKIYVGAAGSETDGGWTTVPSAYFRSAVPDDTFFQLQWVNNHWESVSARGGTGIFRATLDGDLDRADATGAVDNVESLDGAAPPTITTVNNDLSLAGLSGDTCYVIEDTSGEDPEYYFLNIKHHDCP